MLENFNPSNPPQSIIIAGIGLLYLLATGIVFDILLLIRIINHKSSWELLKNRFKENHWTAFDAKIIILTIITMWITLYMVTMTTRYFFGDLTGHLLHFLTAIQSLALPIASFGCIYYLIKAKNTSWTNTFGLQKGTILKNAGYGCIAYVAMMPLFFLVMVIYSQLLEHFNLSTDKQEIINLLLSNQLPSWLMTLIVLLAVTIAPITEELIFRGVFLRLTARHSRLWLAVVFISLLFAGIHMHPASIVPLFFIASMFSLAYIYTGSIITPMVMHALFNGVVLLLLYALKDYLA